MEKFEFEKELIRSFRQQKIFEQFLSSSRIEITVQQFNNLYNKFEAIFDLLEVEDRRKAVIAFSQCFSKCFDPHFFPDYSSFLDSFLELEKVLYMFIPTYRDHLIHAASIFVISIYFIFSLRNVLSPNLLIEPKTLYALYLIGFLHDVGYPVQKFNEIHNELEKLFQELPQLKIKSGKLQISDQIRLMVSDYVEEMLPVVYPDYGLSEADIKFLFLNAWENRQHGMIAALYILFYYRKHNLISADRPIYDHTLIYDIFIRVARAIAFHDEKFVIEGKKIKKAIHLLFEKHPLIFTLRLLDEVQDWGRPSYEFPSFNNTDKVELLSFNIEQIETFDNKYRISISLNVNCLQDDLDFLVDYKKNVFNNFYSSIIGVIINIRSTEVRDRIKRIDIGWTKLRRIIDEMIEKYRGKSILAADFNIEVFSEYKIALEPDIKFFLEKMGVQEEIIENEVYYNINLP